MNGRPVDATDWSRVHDTFAPRLRRVAARYVDPDAVDDIVQETLLRAYRNRHLLDPQRPVGPWLVTIARRTAVDSLRRERARRGAEARLQARSSPADPVADECLNAVRRENVRCALEGLTARHRALLVHELGGTRRRTLAEADGTTEAGLKSALARARANFRSRYTLISDETGVFGAGGVVGHKLIAARLRLQRAVVAVGEQGIATGAATVGIVIVALSAWTAGASQSVGLPTDGPRIIAITEGRGATPRDGLFLPSPDSGSRPSHVDAGSKAHDVADPRVSAQPRAMVTSQATIGSDEEMTRVTVHTRVTTPYVSLRDDYWYAVACRGIVNSTECAVWRQLPTVDLTTEHVGAGAQPRN